MDDKELMKKICAFVKAYQERPLSIEGYRNDITEKYWYFLHAHNILSITNYFGIVTTDSVRKKALMTKFEVNEALLEKYYGITL